MTEKESTGGQHIHSSGAVPTASPRFSTRFANAALLGLAVVMLALIVLGLHAQQRHRIHTFTGTALALAVPYFLAAWIVWRARTARSTLLLTLALAGVFRVGPLLSPVYLSTDAYRYVWDGRVQAHGINPYRYVPADPHLAFLRDAAIYPHINRKEYAPTVYPPFAQAVFWLLTRFGETITTVRLAMVGCEALAAFFIVRLLRDFGDPAQRVLLFAWHPLCIWEFAGGAHCDAVMLAAVALALWAHRRDQPFATGGALALATLVKFFPVVMFPALYRRWRGDWRMPLAFAGTVVAAYLPYVWTFNLRGALGFLPAYTQEEGLASGDRFFFLNLLPTALLRRHGWHPLPTFAALALLTLAGAAAWALWRRPADDRSDLRRSAGLAALFLGLLSAALGWYNTWLTIFLPLLGEASLAWLPSAAFVLYANWLHHRPDEVFLQNAFIFLPALALWLVPAAWRRWRTERLPPACAPAPAVAPAPPPDRR